MAKTHAGARAGRRSGVQAAAKRTTPAAKSAASAPNPPARKPAAKRTATGASRGTSGARGRPSAPARRAESAAARRQRTTEILARLAREHPDARCALDHRNARELLVATVLSAQCTDARVNQVTPALFRRYPTARHYAEAPLGELEEMVKSTGFFRNKARALQRLGQALVAEHGGEVPDAMEALVALPGVGRKTANVVLGNAFGKNEGIVVDTHVQRVSRRLGLTAREDPVKIEQDLMELVPRERWTLWSHLLIFHGRRVCKAPRPECGRCVLADICPSAQV